MTIKKIFKSDVFIFILFLLIFYGIFRYSDSFNHGYDITEDHAFITTSNSLELKSFGSVFEQLMRAELNSLKRFRPIWVIYLISTVEMFGANLLLINIYIVFLCICTSFLLYKFSKNIGFSHIQSFLFALLTMIGPATIMYSRPPDAEIMGMFMLSITLFLLSKSIYSDKHKILYKVGFIVFLLFTCLCKESFLIFTPAILFLYVWIYSIKNEISIIKSLKQNYLIILLASLFTLIIFITIIKLIGINQDRSYSGVDINLFSDKTISDFIFLVFNTNIFLFSLLGIFIFFENELQNNKLSSIYIKRNIKSLLITFLFMLIVIIPQFILYYKTGFIGRYFLPFFMGFSFLLTYIIKIIFESKTISFFIKILYLTAIIFYIFLELQTVTLPSISNFSKKCRATTDLVETIIQDKDKDLLLVFDPVLNFYDIYSIDLYLDYLDDPRDYKYDLVKVDKLGKLFSDPSFLKKRIEVSNKFLEENQFRIIDSSKQYPDINNLLIFDGLTDKFIQKNKNWFNESRFNKKQFGNYTFYSKKD